MRWLVLVLLALPLASAQEGPPLQAEACRPPVLALQQPPVSFEPGSSVNLLMAIENPNGPPVDSVRATLTTTAPAGWSAIPPTRELTLGPQNVSIAALVVTAPNRGSGAADGNVTILVTFVCTSGEIQTTASASDTVRVAIQAFEAPWPIVLGAFAALAGGVGVLAVRRLRRGVALVALTNDRDISPGHSAKFTFLVENRRGKPQRLKLASDGLPEGWSLHLALDTVELEPGEEKTLWAILRAPPHAPAGMDVAATLRLEDPRAAERAVASTTLRAKVGL